ncbi:hypothetical protein [Enterococcus timonensis]|uniref:hypothetical protein n=1 Tax=Enterococcus timonensis TaxID=1852364 RepID=UPI0008DACD15|nr:hypothetical protein [Enterococcus timonensis]
MKELADRLLEKLKKLKGIAESTSSDEVFIFAVETAILDILNYCHLGVDEWPDTLDNTAILMSIDLINETAMTLNPDDVAGVKSLTEGDFSITTETKAEVMQKLLSAPSFARKYTRNLNAFRKLAL